MEFMSGIEKIVAVVACEMYDSRTKEKGINIAVRQTIIDTDKIERKFFLIVKNRKNRLKIRGITANKLK